MSQSSDDADNPTRAVGFAIYALSPNPLLLCSGSVGQWGETATDIQLSASIKTKYSEIVPVLSGQGDKAFITLLGRLRDNPERLE